MHAGRAALSDYVLNPDEERSGLHRQGRVSDFERTRRHVLVRQDFAGKSVRRVNLSFPHLFSRGVSSFAGNLLGTPVQHRGAAERRHYGTTVPLQLVGEDWKPISRLKPQVNNNSR